MYDFNVSKINESPIGKGDQSKFSKNQERELDLIKDHIKKNDSIPEQKFKEISKVPIYFSEINLKNMTAHSKSILWKNYIVKLPNSGLN